MDRYRPAPPPYSAPRRRSIGWLIPTLLLVILAAGWCAFWFYAAEQARIRSRAGSSASSGQVAPIPAPIRISPVFRSGSNSAAPRRVAELATVQPPVQLSASKVTAAVQVYQPTLLLAEIDGPVSIADPGQPPKMTANWSLAQISLRGTPRAPQRVSFAADKMTVDRSASDKPERVFTRRACRVAWPDRVRHGNGKSGDRYRDVARRLRLRQAVHPLATQSLRFRCRYAARRLEKFRAQILGRPLSGNPAGRWPHRSSQHATQAGRSARGRVRQSEAHAVRLSRRRLAGHRDRSREGAARRSASTC